MPSAVILICFLCISVYFCLRFVFLLVFILFLACIGVDLVVNDVFVIYVVAVVN